MGCYISRKKSNLEKKIVISWKFRIFQNSRFSSKHPESDDPSTKIPGNLGHHKTKKCKNIWVSRNSRVKNQIFPGKFLSKFLIFMKIGGRPFHEFPGILVDKIAKNARIYGFPEIHETQSKIFPGNFYEIPKSPIFLNFRKPRNFGEIVTTSKRPQIFNFQWVFH